MQTVDLQISFALQRLLAVAYLLYINQPNRFQLIATPVQPLYTNSLSIVATTPVPALAS